MSAGTKKKARRRLQEMQALFGCSPPLPNSSMHLRVL